MSFAVELVGDKPRNLRVEVVAGAHTLPRVRPVSDLGVWRNLHSGKRATSPRGERGEQF